MLVKIVSSMAWHFMLLSLSIMLSLYVWVYCDLFVCWSLHCRLFNSKGCGSCHTQHSYWTVWREEETKCFLKDPRSSAGYRTIFPPYVYHMFCIDFFFSFGKEPTKYRQTYKGKMKSVFTQWRDGMMWSWCDITSLCF